MSKANKNERGYDAYDKGQRLKTRDIHGVSRCELQTWDGLTRRIMAFYTMYRVQNSNDHGVECETLYSYSFVMTLSSMPFIHSRRCVPLISPKHRR